MSEDIRKRAHEVGFHRAALEAGATITDGPITAFQGGWGHAPLMRGKMIAHHWEVRPTLPEGQARYTVMRSACGVMQAISQQAPMLAPGNLPLCVRCENKLMKASDCGSNERS